MTDLRSIDANLVVVLDAILSKRSITAAADAVGLTQPAVTSALTRLRRLLDDPLIVRSGREFELTERARSLLPLVAEAMVQVGRTFDIRPAFDPATSDRRFSIAASDYVLETMTSRLLSVLDHEAPHVSVEFTALGEVEPVDLLRRDVVIAGAGRAVPGKRQSLFSDTFVCLIRTGHTRLDGGALSIDALSEIPYLQVVLSENIVTVADDALAAAGVIPRVAMTTSGFLTVPFFLEGTDMYAFVPSRLAEHYAEQLGLTVAQTQVPRATLIEAVYWHPSKSSDPAVQWFIRILRKAAELVEFGEETPADA